MSTPIPELIARKRDGGELSAAEIAAVIDPAVPDYQLAAFLMTVVLRGMSQRETRDLLEAMVGYRDGKRTDAANGSPAVSKWRADGTLRHQLRYRNGKRITGRHSSAS